LHTAPDGHGSACSAAAPCSLPTAQERVRALNGRMTTDLLVQLAGGTYRLGSTFTFTAADSGSGGHRVVWQPEPGAHPVISGGRRVTGWHRTDAARNIWTAPVPRVAQDPAVVRGRAADPGCPGAGARALTRAAGGYTAAGDAYSRWRNPSGLEFVYTGGNGAWTESRCRVAGVQGNRITMRQPCWDNVTDRPKPAAQNPYYFPDLAPDAVPTRIENAYELLHTGQWYLDDASHLLSYIPPAGTDPTGPTSRHPCSRPWSPAPAR